MAFTRWFTALALVALVGSLLPADPDRPGAPKFAAFQGLGCATGVRAQMPFQAVCCARCWGRGLLVFRPQHRKHNEPAETPPRPKTPRTDIRHTQPAAPVLAPAPRLIVRPVSDEFRKSLELDPFYEKAADHKGLPILASGRVSDEALVEARYLIGRMLADRDDVTRALVKANCRFVVMARTEVTTDVPEQRDMTPKEYWDKRARGLGGRIASCGEENLLNLKGDRYRNENILVHEFGHCIHQYGLRGVDAKFDARLRAAYTRATDKGLWKGTYAATDASEYWAEGVQSYFDCNAPPDPGIHNDINTREKLAKYDPELFELIDDAFKQSPFRYVRYDKRHTAR